MNQLEEALPQVIEEQSFIDRVHDIGTKAMDMFQSGADWLNDKRPSIGAYAAAGALSVLGLAGTATEAQASTLKPITPKKLERPIANWFYSLQVGSPIEGMPDKSSIMLKPRRYVAKEPCNERTAGYSHLYRVTYSGVYNTACYEKNYPQSLVSWTPRSELQWTPLYNVNFTPLLNKEGTAAAISINVPSEDYGNTTELEVTDFAHDAKIDYAPSDTPYRRHLKEVAINSIHGHLSYHKEWYK